MRSNMLHSTSFISTLLSLISLSFITPSHAQLISPSDLPLSRIQIQFPSVSPPSTPDQLILDTAYMTSSLPYVLYTSSPLTTLPLNITFHSFTNISSPIENPTGEQYFLVVRLINSTILPVAQGMNLTAFQALNSTPGVIELRNISYSTYTNGSYYTIFSSLPQNNKYYFTITHSHFQPSFWSYRLELTQNQTRITTSPSVVSEIFLYPAISQVGTLYLPMLHGLGLDPTFYAGFGGPPLVQQGAFAYVIVLWIRRVADGKMMNNDLMAKGITSVRAHWSNGTQQQQSPPNYFELSLSLTNTPSPLSAYPRLPLPPSALRYDPYYVLKVDDFMDLDSSNQPTVPATMIFTPPKRVSQWKISFPAAADGREVSDNFDSLSEYEYATQQQEYHITIPATPASSSSSQSTTTTTSCLFSFPSGIHGSFGATILSWYNSFETNFDELNQLSTIQNPYPIVSVPIPTTGDGQTKVVLITSAGQNITWWLKRSSTDTVTVVDQTSVLQSYQQQIMTLQSASKNLTSSGTTDIFLPISQSPSSYVALQRFTSNHTTTVSLPTQFLSQKINVTVTPTSSSMDSTVRRDVYDPSSSQWIRDSVTTQLSPASGTVKCSSSTPGTIALLRKIVTHSEVDPETDGKLRYGHAKNDIALVVGLLVVGGLLFLLMLIGGLVSFMRETREMQAQINELKKAMMEGEDSRDRSDSTNSEEGDAEFLPSTPMIQHVDNRSDDQPHQHISSHHVSIQIRNNNNNNNDHSYADCISSTSSQNLQFPPVIAPQKAPYPRISDLAPEFRPLSDDELAIHYGHLPQENNNHSNDMNLHTISEYDHGDSHSRSSLI